MNISQPVASAVESVEFTFLSTKEIRAASVRRIENETTFDNFLNPTPGGLYDPALGAWGSSPCATCNLGQSLCPGHTGHIDLPVPVYHPVFMDQVLRLLRAECRYCHHFRMAPLELNRYVCKLRLLQYGLLAEAANIDAIGEDFGSMALPGVPQISDEAEDESQSAGEHIARARNGYVRRVLQHYKASAGDIRKGKHEGASEMRRELIKQFLKDVVVGRDCKRCKGISPGYRKDRFVRIFERSLNPKDQAKMAASRLKPLDALTIRQKNKPVDSDTVSDEGIADIDLDSVDDNASTDGQDADELDENGNLLPRATHKSSHTAQHSHQRYINAGEVLGRLKLLFQNEQDLLRIIYSSRPRGKDYQASPDMFFIQAVLVPPNKYRPEARMGDSEVTEAQQNSLYKSILTACAKVTDIYSEIPKSTSESGRQPRDIIALHEAWADLQNSVNSLIDRNKNPVTGQNAKRLEEGIKQKLEKKEGLFRKNMMGKRVNFAARSVISPDPNIETNEIGVPPVFARKLTYPEPVTSHNFKVLQQAVINGPETWPGASAIENENGQVVNLRGKSLEDRMALANQLLAPTSNSSFSSLRGKKVYRHLSNGDVVLMNRQPTLHKPSIMGHRVRVLPGEKTIRMHYANCNTYNADFDGDEMNMHFPQNEIARVEALQLADTDHQYLSGTQGKPLRGLIQDHISISVGLCSKDSFFNRGEYQELIYSALRPESGHIFGDRIQLVEPAVLKPVRRWTGKQVITTILKNIKPPNRGNLWMSGDCQVSGSRWGASHAEEGTVNFRDGVLVTGILDKAHLGPSSGGFIHAIHEIYGPAIAGKVLSCLGRLLTKLLNMRAFTCGLDDLRLTQEGEENRKKQLRSAMTSGLGVAAGYVSLQDHNPTSKDPELLRRLEDVMRDDSKQEGLDALMNKAGGEVSTNVTKACLPAGLEKQFPHNHMQLMTTSGAKGGNVNANLISCNLGQQVLEGRRVPLMISGKSLPCFPEYDTSLRAGGYVVNRFLTGIRPQEYYFHHMAGREGLIDTAVKTSRSGYLQRCLIKGMEGLEVAYDSSVRDSDGSLVQFLYGEDGLDVTKQKYLTDFTFLLHNLDSEMSHVQLSDPRTATLFNNKDDFVKQMKRNIRKAGANRSFSDVPVSELVNPAQYAFATSEKFYGKMASYVQKNKDGLVKEKEPKKEKTPALSMSRDAAYAKKTVERIFAAKYLRSQVEPGEAVGIVAGQSVGEPSTQMTLNTFHLAGHSAKNVTLGIPRLREILMTASSNISTPAMTLVVAPGVTNEEAEQFAKSISVLPLSHVLDKITVKERLGKGVGHNFAKIFEVRLQLFPSSKYTTFYAVKKGDVLNALEKKLMPMLHKLLAKAVKQLEKAANNSAIPEVGTAAGVVETADVGAGGEGGVAGDDDDSEDEDGDGDATSAKKRANRNEAVSYGPNDDDDDAIQTQMDHDAASDNELPDDEGYSGSPPETAENSANDSSDDSDAGADRVEGVQSTKAQQAAKTREREVRVKSAYADISRFRVDEKSGGWCEFTLELAAETPKILMLSVVEDAVRKSVVRQIAGVGSCTFVPDEKVKDSATGGMMEQAVIHTVGTNLRAMQQFGDYVDTNRLVTNDIVSVLDMYGVEAGRNTIIHELSAVFESHGIGVDNRHLNLIADHMTRGGGFTPFNRYGLKGNVSPFTKMSFETTLGVLKDALEDGDWDGLVTPSSRIVMGQLGKTGTGAFDVLTRVPTAHYDPLQGM